MNNKNDLRERQIKILNKLESFKKKLWTLETTEEIKEVSERIFQDLKEEKPATRKTFESKEISDEKEKNLILKVLKTDIETIDNYSSIKDQQFAIASTISIAMGVFTNLGVVDITEMIDKNASR